MAVPFVHHFLSRLRDLQTRAKSRRVININKECRNDLLLMINVIKTAHRGDQFEHHRIQTSDPRLPLRLVPSRIGRIWRQRFCMAVLPPALPPIPCNEQPIGTPCCNHHPLDRYHQGSATAGQLRSLHDRQHHIRRLALQDELQRAWRQPTPSHSPHRSRKNARNALHDTWNQRIQPVVQGRSKRGR